MNKLDNIAISASAGSGKTFQLAHRYIRLLAEDVDPDRICALTFSRKAACEILDDLIRYLSEAAMSEDNARTAAKRIGKAGCTKSDFLGMLRNFTEHIHSAHIGTLDSFMVGVVRAFPSELGVPAGFEVVDSEGPAGAELQQEALSGLLLGSGGAERRRFHEAFKEATFGFEEKSLSVTLNYLLSEMRSVFRMHRAECSWGDEGTIWPGGNAWLRGKGDAQKAAAELLEWIGSGACPEAMRKPLLKIVGFAGKYDERSLWDNSLDKNALFERLLSQADDLRRGSASVLYNRKEYTLGKEQCARLHVLLRHLVGIELRRSLRRTRGLYGLLAQYEAAYERAMRSGGKMSFEDAQYLLTGANEASGGSLLSRERGRDKRLYIDYRLDCRLDHWLLDEFQDTSDLQWAVLGNLVDEIVQDDSGNRSFFYVGDIKQAIYGWRGGNACLFGKVLDRYRERITQLPQNVSRRSVPTVIEAVNRTFGSLADKDYTAAAVRFWNNVWQEHHSFPGPGKNDGYVALLEPGRGSGKEKPTQEDLNRVAARIVKEIDPVNRGISCAILVRRNETGRQIVNMLRSECRHMPVSHEGASAIADNPVVSLMMSLVRFAAHPGDNFAWRHLQMSPLAGCFAADGASRDGLAPVLLAEIQAGGFRPFVRRWADRIEAAARLSPFEIQRLDDLTGAAAEYDLAGRRDCDAFLRFIAGYTTSEVAAENHVRVMTVHKAKGLGFDMVILPDLMDHGMDKGSGAKLATGGDNDSPWVLHMPRAVIATQDKVLSGTLAKQEEDAAIDSLCVLYVAMTRAREAMYLVTGFPGGSAASLTPGRFLKRRLAGGDDPEPVSHPVYGGETLDCLYDNGNAAWHKAPRAKRKAEPGGAPGRHPSRGAAGGRLPVAADKITRVEPSAKEDMIRDAAWLFTDRARDELAFGIAMHRLMSRVEWSDNADPGAIFAEWAPRSAESGVIRGKIRDQFANALASTPVRNAMAKPAGKVELWRERRFEAIIGQEWISGAFDRVVIRRNEAGLPLEAEVLDFKSDRITASEIPATAEKYRGQMILYGRALSHMLKLDRSRIRLRLVFTRPASVADVPWSGQAG